MKNRRQFIKWSALTGGLILAKTSVLSGFSKGYKGSSGEGIPQPMVLSTWNHGIAANDAAWTLLGQGGKALDAVEKGVRVTESDPENRSVGLGGLPDRDGHVTLDACIMDERSRVGSVAFLQHIENPISVARKVMEDTPHVMLVGQGALEFALDKGFEKTNLLTDGARKEWEAWRKTSNYQPVINRENHDTIGMIGMDAAGNLSGACTTSGLSYKMHGRVGDSPIIGAGLFVDNEVGAATATGIYFTSSSKGKESSSSTSAIKAAIKKPPLLNGILLKRWLKPFRMTFPNGKKNNWKPGRLLLLMLSILIPRPSVLFRIISMSLICIRVSKTAHFLPSKSKTGVRL